MSGTRSTKPLGGTAVRVTDVSFGTSGIGNLYRAVDDREAAAVLDAAWQAGIRFFDTAPFYGFGLAKRRLGDFLRSRPAGSYVLATKVGRLLDPVAPGEVPDHGFVAPLPFAPRFDYSYDGVMRSIEQSYARLGLSRIDVVWVHDIGALTHGDANRAHMDDLFTGGLRALSALKASGAIGAYGLGVNEMEVCLDVMARAPIDAILLAGRFTVLDRSADRLLRVCADNGTSIVAGGVFNSGILATGARPGAHFDYGPASGAVLDRVRAMEAIAAQKGVPLAAAALQFPLRNAAVASVLIGTGTVSNLTRNLSLFDQPIPAEIWPELDAQAIYDTVSAPK